MGYQRSAELFERAKKTIAGGVTSDVRISMKPMPLYFERGEGAMLYDVDGNGYIDYALGQGPLILGHSPPAVLDAVEEAMRRGQIYAGQSELEVQAAEAVADLVPCAGLCRFSLSGSEAVHAAVRLAKAVTGRRKLLRFEGHYHGWFDNVLVGPSGDGDGATAMTEGQSPGAVAEVIVQPWNDLDAIEATFARHGGELAAVIMEPVMCNTGVIPPDDDYLEGVRAYCDRYGSLLILDEVITGFRLAPGGAQERLGVTADLATYGKALAGGFPASAIVGRSDLMERFGSGVNHSGTFNGNIISSAATVAALHELTRDDNAAYKRIEHSGSALMTGLREIAAASIFRWSSRVTRQPSTPDSARPVHSPTRPMSSIMSTANATSASPLRCWIAASASSTAASGTSLPPTTTATSPGRWRRPSRRSKRLCDR